MGLELSPGGFASHEPSEHGSEEPCEERPCGDEGALNPFHLNLPLPATRAPCLPLARLHDLEQVCRVLGADWRGHEVVDDRQLHSFELAHLLEVRAVGARPRVVELHEHVRHARVEDAVEMAARGVVYSNQERRPEAFAGLRPYGQRVWLQCPTCGYEWREGLRGTRKESRKCPSCHGGRGHYLAKGSNDLGSKRPATSRATRCRRRRRRASRARG